jgi:hypothetical protein
MANESNLKAAILELRGVLAQHLPADDVADVLRKAVHNALADVLGDAMPRRGRPRKDATAPTSTSPKSRRGRSEESRRRQGEKMRAYWAARKAAESGGAPRKKRGRPAKGAAEASTVAE